MAMTTTMLGRGDEYEGSVGQRAGGTAEERPGQMVRPHSGSWSLEESDSSNRKSKCGPAVTFYQRFDSDLSHGMRTQGPRMTQTDDVEGPLSWGPNWRCLRWKY